MRTGTLTLNAADRLSDSAAVSVLHDAVLHLGGNDGIDHLDLAGTLEGSGALAARTYALSSALVNADLGGGAITSSGASRIAGVAGAASVTVNDGTLTLASAGRLSAAPAVTVAADAHIALGGNETFGTLAGAGAVDLSTFTLGSGSGGDSSYAGVLSGSGGFTNRVPPPSRWWATAATAAPRASKPAR